MQAITTKFIGPTNTRGSRVKATCQAKSRTTHWNHAENTDENHTRAARLLAEELGWSGRWVGGGLPDGKGNAYVNAEWVRMCDQRFMFLVTEEGEAGQ